MHCHFIEAVSANASGGWQVVDGVDVNRVFVELVGVRLVHWRFLGVLCRRHGCSRVVEWLKECSNIGV